LLHQAFDFVAIFLVFINLLFDNPATQPASLTVIGRYGTMATAGVIAGAAGGYALTRLAGSNFTSLQIPGAVPVVASALVLLAAAVIASVLPAARAARVDVMQALRSN
jgi:putative ABC transport system permease protein